MNKPAINRFRPKLTKLIIVSAFFASAGCATENQKAEPMFADKPLTISIASKEMMSEIRDYCASKNAKAPHKAVELSGLFFGAGMPRRCNRDCEKLLSAGVVEFIEIDVKKIKEKPDALSLQRQTGIHRYRLENKGSPSCALSRIRKKTAPNYEAKIPADKCLAVTTHPEISAQHSAFITHSVEFPDVAENSETDKFYGNHRKYSLEHLPSGQIVYAEVFESLRLNNDSDDHRRDVEITCNDSRGPKNFLMRATGYFGDYN